MNQVMINSVDLDMMMQEIKDLRADVLRLKRLLSEERNQVELLKSEVAWAENGYTTKETK
jgi:hypothetical protein